MFTAATRRGPPQPAPILPMRRLCPRKLTNSCGAATLEKVPLADDDAGNEPTWQLCLTFEFEQNNDLRALGLGDKWAGPLSELPDFRAYVYRSPVFTTCSKHKIHRTIILQFGA
jgi:hypothetical protein